MNQFDPFIGTRYNSSKVRMANVVSPPYDVISTEQRDAFYELDAHNVIRLELNRDDDPYASAKRFFDTWKQEGILVTEDAPAYYVYYQTFSTPTGEQVTRRGVLGRLTVTPYSEGNVLPHERTLPKAKKDRFALLETTGTQFSPIFGLIDDSALVFDHTVDGVTAMAPLADVDEVLPTGARVRHTLWKLTDPPLVTRLQKLIASKQIVIADGHHRYETAVAFAETHPDLPGADGIMIFLSNLRGEGTIILPTHRVLHSLASFDQYSFLANLEKQFDLQTFEHRDAALAAFDLLPSALTLIGFPDEPYWVVVSERNEPTGTALERLGVYRLHERILKPIAALTQEQIDAKSNLWYPHTVDELEAMTSRDPYNAAFLLKSVTADEMMEVTKEGAYMPQKSTYFYPKLLSGLVFQELSAQR